MPILVTKHFGGQALELGLIDSAWGLGVVGGGLLLGVWGGFKRRLYTSMFGLVLMGSGVVIIGAAPANLLWLALFGISKARQPLQLWRGQPFR